MSQSQKGVRCIHFISGPSNSGKSLFAEKVASSYNDVIYVATMPHNSRDKLLCEKISKHKLRRPTSWHLLETNSNLTDDLSSLTPYQLILIDSLGGFVTSCLSDSRTVWQRKQEQLIKYVKSSSSHFLIVSEEITWSVCPPTADGFLFSNRLSRLSETFAILADHNWLVVQNLALNLRKIGIPINDFQPSS